MRSRNVFISDLKAGNNAEKNFWYFAGQVCSCNILSPVRTNQELVEGKDIQALGITKKGLQVIKAEIKGVLNNTFIVRDNDNLEASGSLPFELFGNSWDENGRIKPRSRWTMGWLPAMLHPKAFNEYAATADKSVTVQRPDQLAFMLCSDNEGKKPYACILFEDFEKLMRRLYQIAPFDLDHLVPPTHRFDYWINKNLNVPFNVWYVAVEELIDLARITIFEDVPIQIDQQKKKCPIRVQNARRDYLINHAVNIVNLKEEYQRIQSAGRAFNLDRGLLESANIPHMTFFDPSKLPSWVEYSDIRPDWLKNIES